MTIKFNVPGKKRRELVQSIAKWLGEEVMYMGAPSFAYHVGNQIIDRDGNVSLVRLDDETVERLLEHLYDEGFESESLPEADEPSGIAIQIPAADFTEGSLNNLQTILEAKGGLIKKALGVDSLPVNRINERLDFPWFVKDASPEELHAYMSFITKLCEMAKTQKRVNIKEKEVDNEKYAFRCFLLRLGFIGDEFKEDRKILLRNLSGSSAFKSGQKSEVSE